MERESEDRRHDHSLYLAADGKIDKVKDQITELYRETHTNKEQISHLFNRLDFGVSKTGQENATKLTEMAVKMNNLEHDLAGEKSTVQQLEKNLGRITAGIFWVSFTGIVGGLLAVAYQIMRVHLLGNG
jgi:predicted RNase H-like nuclease (RuvC/YqgF family)